MLSAPLAPIGPAFPSGMPSAGDDVPRDSDPRLASGEHWAFVNRGRMYTVDEFGIKIVPGSTRPPAVPPDDWKRMSQN